MAPNDYTPAEVATQIGVSVNTIHNWCKLYAAYLSAGANPAKGIARKLTNADIAVFQAIRDWKEQGVEGDELLARLATLDRDKLQPYIEAPPSTLQSPAEEVQTSILPAPAGALAEFTGMLDRRMVDILAAVEGVERRVEERVQGVKEETRREMEEKLWQYRVMVIVLGLLCGLLGVTIFVVAQGR